MYQPKITIIKEELETVVTFENLDPVINNGGCSKEGRREIGYSNGEAKPGLGTMA